jgi:hypothetical protein
MRLWRIGRGAHADLVESHFDRDRFDHSVRHGDGRRRLHVVEVQWPEPDAVTARLFLESCLKAANLEAGFCDGVPGPTELLKSISWQAQLNQKYGLRPPFESAVLPQSIIAFCESRLAPPPR